MPGLSDSGENLVLDFLFNGTGTTYTGGPTADIFVSLHTADPADTGANEVTGGAGPYARQQAAFGASASGTLSNTANIDFLGMPAVTVVGWGIWSAASAGTCYVTGYFAPAAGFAVIHHTETADDNLYTPDHALVNDDRVVFEVIEGQALPGGVTAGTVYWVTGTPGADDFQISTTQDGGAVDITTDGQAICREVTPKVVNAGDTFRIAAGDLDVFATE